jgi:type I restriction enzyme, S subunit
LLFSLLYQILKSAILQKAFQGKLAAQDDNDPPASELLEQIKQEREQALALIQEAKQAKKADKPKTPKRTKKAKTTENQ